MRILTLLNPDNLARWITQTEPTAQEWAESLAAFEKVADQIRELPYRQKGERHVAIDNLKRVTAHLDAKYRPAGWYAK